MTAIALTLAAALAAQDARPAFKDCADCLAMVAIPPGSFMMGSTDAETVAENEPAQFAAWEKPRHRVTIAYLFALGRTEVTVAQYAAFVAARGERPGAGCAEWDFARNQWDKNPARTWRDPMHPSGDDHPVVCVDWADAKAYVAWLADRTGKPYRLATEAEWEYAARAGTETARFWGDDRHAACAYANVYDLDGKEG
jgi:formylglycine-generating enzyme required for sulfatase activity